jgi:hypothetical protein
MSFYAKFQSLLECAPLIFAKVLDTIVYLEKLFPPYLEGNLPSKVFAQNFSGHPYPQSIIFGPRFFYQSLRSKGHLLCLVLSPDNSVRYYN